MSDLVIRVQLESFAMLEASVRDLVRYCHLISGLL
jgi:hypothetical protein